jgi:hypothetical protein
MSRSSGASETSCGTKDKSYSGPVCSFSVPGCQEARHDALAKRRAASLKAAATRKRQAEVRAFMATGAPIGPRPSRGTARGDYSPAELIASIRATLDRMRAKEAGQ